MKAGLAGSVGRIRQRTVVWRRKKHIGKDKGALSIVGQAGPSDFCPSVPSGFPQRLATIRLRSGRERVFGIMEPLACVTTSAQSVSPGTFDLVADTFLATHHLTTTYNAGSAESDTRSAGVLRSAPRPARFSRGSYPGRARVQVKNTGGRECQETPALPFPHSPAT